MTKELIFSGIQPTGNLHLGNYLGAIKNWVALQEKYRSIFCIVDMHAITVPQNPEELTRNIRATAATYIACGIDPEKNIIFSQSTVPGHAELAWILGCSTPMGWLNRMTQFKEKTQQSKVGVENIIANTRGFMQGIKKLIGKPEECAKIFTKAGIAKDSWLEKEANFLSKLIEIFSEDQKKSSTANLGLYSYPVLMAADILLYKTTHVPVGEDQKQHLELARDIAGAFNRQFGTDYFPLPEPLILGTATRVMSLRDGTKKMSKSDESDYSRINLTDDSDAIRLKIQKAKSDAIRSVTENLEARPEAQNLLNIYLALTGKSKDQAGPWAGFADFKKELAEVTSSVISPISKEIQKLTKDISYINSILETGAEKANEVAQKNLREIKKLIGFPVF